MCVFIRKRKTKSTLTHLVRFNRKRKIPRRKGIYKPKNGMNNKFKAFLKLILTSTAWKHVRKIYEILHPVTGLGGGRTNDLQ